MIRIIVIIIMIKLFFIKIGTYMAHHRKNQCHSKEEKENLVHSWFTNIFSLPS